jgi:cytochrome c oxidase subunit 2
MPNVRIRLPRPTPPALALRPIPPRSRVSTRSAIVGLPLLALLLAGCMPSPVTPQGREVEQLYNIVFAIAAAIFLFVEGLIVYAVIRYRRRPTDTSLPVQTHGNNLLEVIWTVIPTIIVVVLFVLSWQTLNSIDKVSAQTDVRIRAVAQRFQWSFEYLSPDGQQVLFTQLLPEMSVPVGTTVHLALRSPDVIHAFYVPRFLFKRDVVPGQENVFEFSVDEDDAGQSFSGQCAELCGEFHGAMVFTVRAMTQADYQAWLQQQIDKANATPSPAPSGAPPSGAPPSGAPASGAPSGPPPSGQPGQVTVQLAAQNIAFDKTEITAPPQQNFTIEFHNNDAGIPHNVEIKDSGGASLFQGEIFNGVDTRLYAVPALNAGDYTFVCTVHPNMTGALSVE